MKIYLVWYWDDDNVPTDIAVYLAKANAIARKEKEEKDSIAAIITEYETED